MGDPRPLGDAVRSVRIERRGGLAGLHPCVERQIAELTAAQRAALDALPAASVAPAAPGADRFVWRVTLVGTSGAEHTVDVPETAMPATLSTLVRPTLP